MQSSKRKKEVGEEDDRDGMVLETHSDDNGMIDLGEVADGEVLDVNFDFDVPTERFQGEIENFLIKGNYPMKMRYDQIAEHICSQKTVGTIVRSDDTLLGFITLLIVQHHSEEEWLKILRQYICTHIPSEENISEYFEDNRRTGILFSERFINVPLEVGSVLHELLLGDLSAVKKSLTDQQSNPFFFDTLLLFVNAYEHQGTSSKREKREIEFPKIEDGMYMRNAAKVYSLPDSGGGGSLPFGIDYHHRRYLCVIDNAEKVVSEVFNELRQLV